jgi:hypothetical protein
LLRFDWAGWRKAADQATVYRLAFAR